MNVELSQDDVQNIINAYDKDIKKMKQQENEIDRLNNLNKQLVEECQRLDDEETRLNNIISELEKYIIDEIDDAQEELNIILQGDNLDYKNECTKEFNCIKNALDMLLDKLKALKENNK